MGFNGLQYLIIHDSNTEGKKTKKNVIKIDITMYPNFR